jgi:hypothetical protein
MWWQREKFWLLNTYCPFIWLAKLLFLIFAVLQSFCPYSLSMRQAYHAYTSWLIPNAIFAQLAAGTTLPPQSWHIFFDLNLYHFSTLVKDHDLPVSTEYTWTIWDFMGPCREKCLGTFLRGIVVLHIDMCQPFGQHSKTCCIPCSERCWAIPSQAQNLDLMTCSAPSRKCWKSIDPGRMKSLRLQ